MKKILTAKNIWKRFINGNEPNTVIKGVSIEIEEGEFVAIMGTSGSGKSTLLHILSSIDKADEGEISFDGMDISNMSDDRLSDMRRTRFGFVFQQPTFLKNLNILENIVLPSLYHRGTNKKEKMEKAKELMKKTGISGLEDRKITDVSGGQLQRAGICRAILHSPDLLFADEPTGALDSKSGEEVIRLFREINRSGIAILLVTHDKKVAAQSDRILFMKDGSIVEELRLNDLTLEERLEQIESTSKNKF